VNALPLDRPNELPGNDKPGQFLTGRIERLNSLLAVVKIENFGLPRNNSARPIWD
jgi:hypothetical protein